MTCPMIRYYYTFIQTQRQRDISGGKIYLVVNMNLLLLLIMQENFNFFQRCFSIFKSNYNKNTSITVLCAEKEFKLYWKESVRAWIILSKRIPVLGHSDC